MKIQLSDHFTYKKLVRFTVPSIIMMIFTSIYGVVDGIFVSNFVGKTPFAAVNLIMPVCMITGAFGFMIGTGGSALVSRLMGEGKKEKANSVFSMLTAVSALIGITASVIGIAFMPQIAAALGAEGEMFNNCVLYGRILLMGITAFVLQNEFQSFLVAAERPKLGLAATVGAGVTNIVLDALFVAVFKWGLAGAAIATVTSQAVGAVIPLIFFLRSKDSILRLGKFSFDGGALLRACTNGSSEMMTNLSMSLVNMLYNAQLMKLAGENGIAAYGVIMYVAFIFAAIFIGYSIGSAPVISFNYGAANHDELKNMRRKSFVIIGVCTLLMVTASQLLAAPLSGIFVGYDAELMSLTERAFRLYSLSFILSGFNIFGSAFFTALNNGLISAVISFLRTLVFQIAAVLLLPLVLGLDGIWLSVAAAELLAAFVTVILLVKMRKRYNY